MYVICLNVSLFKCLHDHASVYILLCAYFIVCLILCRCSLRRSGVIAKTPSYKMPRRDVADADRRECCLVRRDAYKRRRVLGRRRCSGETHFGGIRVTQEAREAWRVGGGTFPLGCGRRPLGSRPSSPAPQFLSPSRLKSRSRGR